MNVVNYVKQNSYFLNCIYDSVDRDELKRFFYKDFIGITEKIINECTDDLNVNLTNDFKYFLCNFYTEALAGMLIDLFQNPDKYNQNTMFSYFSIILKSSLPDVIQAQQK